MQFLPSRAGKGSFVAVAVAALTAAATAPSLVAPSAGATRADAAKPFLHGLDKVTTVASTIPANGDENPYAVYVAPYSVGHIHAGDVLVDDFNSVDNDQGTGTTVLLVTPSGTVDTFASLPRHLPGCPGGVGLTTAMTELRDGWVLVGSAPTTGGTTATAGRGCLVVLSSDGHLAETLAAPELDGPWDLATVDHGSSATLLVTNTLIGVGRPGQATVRKGDLVRLELRFSTTSAPVITSSTVVASGFPERADVESRLVVGPTGVVLEGSTAYVANPLANDIVAVPDALGRTSSDGTGHVLTSGGELRGPLAMTAAPNGDLLATNGLNGDVVEVSPSGRQVAHAAVDPDPAQSPPGNGDLFGIAVAPSGKALYFAKDDTNTLAELS